MEQWFRVATWAYLILPLALFFGRGLRPAGAVAVVAALVAAAAIEVRRGVPDGPAAPRFSALGWVAALVPLGVVLAFSGVGGLGLAWDDWAKHNAILADLSEQPWPVAWELGGERLALVYYLAYYVPAAVAGALAGWKAANVALILWTLLGSALAVGWLVLLTRAAPLLCGLVFVLFGGMDGLAYVVTKGLGTVLSEAWRGGMWEWWAGWFLYPSNVELLFWVPQHAIGGWLGMALVLSAAGRGDARFPAILVVAVAAFWSPLVAIGLAALAWIPGVAGSRGTAEALRAQIGLPNAVGLGVGLLVALYYASRWVSFELPLDMTTGLHAIPDGILPLALDLDAAGWMRFLRRWAGVCVLEFGALAFAIALARGGLRASRGFDWVWLASVGLLILLPWFRYGYANDLPMRASIPALYTLLVLAIAALRGWRTRPLGAALVATVLLVGSLTPLAQFQKKRALTAEGAWLRPPAREDTRDLFGVHRRYQEIGSGFEFVTQYIGAADAPYFRWLARPLEPRSIHPERQQPPR